MRHLPAFASLVALSCAGGREGRTQDSGVEPACTADIHLSGDLVSTMSDGTCSGRGGEGFGVDGIDFAAGGTVATDRVAFTVELVNWVPSSEAEVLEQVSALVEVFDIEQQRTWSSLDRQGRDPAGCVFDGSTVVSGPFDAVYLSGAVRCSRPLEESSGDSAVSVDGDAMVGGLGPVPQ